MIERIIEFSGKNRFFVLLIITFGTVWGLWSLYNVTLDAIPDLSDVQVIVFTEWPGRSPDLMEDQITYPIVTSMIAAPNVQLVRGISQFGLSYVYIIFEDGTDMYWARSRVLEYLQEITGQLPEGVNPALGPDATGVGWVFEYALVDKTGRHNLAQLRSFQDWYLRYWLESVPGVAEVASVGGYDLPPRTSPPSKLDLGPLEVHSREQNRVLETWGVWPPAPAADRPRRCEAVSGCTPFATSRLAPLLPTTCRRSLR